MVTDLACPNPIVVSRLAARARSVANHSVARLLGSGEFPMDSSLSAGQGPELPGGAVGMMGIRVTSTALLTGRFHGFAHSALAVEISR